MWLAFGQIALGAMLVFLILGTLLNLSNHPHWFVRGWDFPRIQIAGVALVLLALYAVVVATRGGSWQSYDLLLATATVAMVVWQASQIFFYTPLAGLQVLATRNPDDSKSFRMVVSNVQMENDQVDHWLKVIREADPDVLLALEINASWLEALQPLRSEYRYEVAQPQENYYGMLLLSRLELREPEVRFIVQDDVPSIHTVMVLPNGQEVRLCGVHPRPPEPIRDEDSGHRDAELVVIARELADEPRPAVIGGDLNDVAWSYTTRLFLSIGGMLDPRRGRGFFNTWNADHVWFRFPLDHVFHSPCFSLRELRRLDYAGSDHFPMLIRLQYEPEVQPQQPTLAKSENDEEEAQEIIDREEEEENTRIDSVKRQDEGGSKVASP